MRARLNRLTLSFLSLLALTASTRTAAAADPPTVAVLYFNYEGKDGELALLKKGLAQMLISDLSGNDSIRVVERERLEEVLGELKLQGTNKIDQTSAVKAGKLLGARFLVLGGYFDIAKKLRIDARVIEVETGKIVLSIGANGKPEEFLTLEQDIALKLGIHFSKILPPPPRARSTRRPGRRSPSHPRRSRPRR